MRYVNSAKSNDIVRVMQGNPLSKKPAQRVPYVVRQPNGKFYDKNGNVVSRINADSHMPYDLFVF